MRPTLREVLPGHVRRPTRELEFYAELARELASNSDLQPILDWIVKRTAALLSADQGWLKLLDPEASEALTTTSVRTDPSHWRNLIAETLLGYMKQHRKILATPDLLEDPHFSACRELDAGVRSVLATPVMVENRLVGMLAVATAQAGRRWTHDERRLVSILAGHSAEVIERARARAQIARTHAELAVAHQIQMGLVPSGPLSTGPWNLFGRVVPAGEIGGDYFDYFPLGAGRTGVVIADVAGKGVPAALLVSCVRASVRAYCDGRRAISDAIQEVNRGLYSCNVSERFVTLFYGEVDDRRGRIRYTNAGHPRPLLRRSSGSLEELAAGGYPLGVFEDSVYEEGEALLSPKDGLLLYSDGVIEAEDGELASYGDERLRSVWMKCLGMGPTESVERILAAVDSFRGSATQADDITVVVIS